VHKPLKYALVTSSALPNEIKESDHYIDLEKEQWLDLIDYSTEVVKTDENQEILFLIVAKGTSEQQAEDDARRAKRDAERLELHGSLEELTTKLESLDKESCECIDERDGLQEKNAQLEKQLDTILGSKDQLKDELDNIKESQRLKAEKQAEKEMTSKKQKEDLRKKSISLFNALYKK
tara:strand:- start:17 stop:550 length:534 start_codon:yes stop_codon:yes gene_type:complete